MHPGEVGLRPYGFLQVKEIFDFDAAPFARADSIRASSIVCSNKEHLKRILFRPFTLVFKQSKFQLNFNMSNALDKYFIPKEILEGIVLSLGVADEARRMYCLFTCLEIKMEKWAFHDDL